jgi:hypothetical protein
MTLKKILLNKYNFYLFLLFIIISIFGSVYIYKSKELHSYLTTYKVRLPHITSVDKEQGIGVTQKPLMQFYEFRSFIDNHHGISNNCLNFSESVRVSIWEARNELDWRIEIKHSDTKDTRKCINQIVNAIDEKKENEILSVKALMELETSIFEESVKKVIADGGFLEFKSFIDQKFKDDDKPAPDKFLKVLAAALKVELGPDEYRKQKEAYNFSENFLRGYIYNFMDSYRSYRYINRLSETKYEKTSQEYFLKKNILKFNFAILFLLVLSLLTINFKNLKKLF